MFITHNLPYALQNQRVKGQSLQRDQSNLEPEVCSHLCMQLE